MYFSLVHRILPVGLIVCAIVLSGTVRWFPEVFTFIQAVLKSYGRRGKNYKLRAVILATILASGGIVLLFINNWP
jgi:hypothetical protein